MGHLGWAPDAQWKKCEGRGGRQWSRSGVRLQSSNTLKSLHSWSLCIQLIETNRSSVANLPFVLSSAEARHQDICNVNYIISSKVGAILMNVSTWRDTARAPRFRRRVCDTLLCHLSAKGLSIHLLKKSFLLLYVQSVSAFLRMSSTLPISPSPSVLCAARRLRPQTGATKWGVVPSPGPSPL
jgi:hypothetical protein